MTRYTADDIRDFVDKHQRGGDWNYNDLIPILRQAADDAEFRQLWGSSGKAATRTPKEQTR